MVTVTIVVIFMGLMIMGVPVVIAMAAGTLAGFAQLGFTASLPKLYVFPLHLLERIDSPALLAIPFFILAGHLMTAIGITDRIFALANALVGHLRGGLAQVNVICSLLFGGITGSALADVAGIGNLIIRQMEKRGYPTDYAAALTVAASIIGPTMWPSVPLLIYAFGASVSVERMFLAGIGPGVLVVLSLMIYNRIVATRFNVPLSPRPSAIEIAKLASKTVWALVAPMIIVGSVLTGVATAMEAGVIACIYTFLLCLAYRSLEISRVRAAIRDTAILFGSVLMVIGVSVAMSWLLTYDQVPQQLASGVLSLTHNKYIFLFLVAVFFLLIGTVLENIPAMVILIPIMMPLVDHFGIDRVHFGLIMVYGLLIGIVHPPVGVALFVVTKVAKISFDDVCRSVLPFLVPLIIVLFIITFLPDVVLWLPNKVLGIEKIQ